jgi:DNA polymerase I-like protein with 3'-5' exonuclease and polymerase domains
MHIAGRLKELYDWKPKEFTPNGSAKVDEVTLGELDYPEAKLLTEYLTITKRLGQLADGPQAWLQKVESDGKIHGYINSLGTVSGRASHSFPNLGQVVAVNKPYGRECRELFSAEPGYKLCGADLSGLELRVLSHFLAQFDDGQYRDTVLSADVHEANRIAAGLPDRAAAKRFIYCLIFGGGNSKLGETVGGTPEDGAALKAKFFKANPAFKTLVDRVKNFAEKNKYLPGLDDRHLTVRSSHSALNLLIQSAGALIAKRALVIFKQLLKDNGLEDKVKLVLWIHDEFQIQFREDLDEDTIGKYAIQSFKEAGEHYNFKCPITGEFSIGGNWAETH